MNGEGVDAVALPHEQRAMLAGLVRTEVRRVERAQAAARVKWGASYDPTRNDDRIAMLERCYRSLGKEPARITNRPGPVMPACSGAQGCREPDEDGPGAHDARCPRHPDHPEAKAWLDRQVDALHGPGAAAALDVALAAGSVFSQPAVMVDPDVADTDRTCTRVTGSATLARADDLEPERVGGPVGEFMVQVLCGQGAQWKILARGHEHQFCCASCLPAVLEAVGGMGAVARIRR